MMPPLRLCLVLLLGVGAPLGAAAVTDWDHVSVGPMKTSFYIGSVTLKMETFVRQGANLTTNYEARVFPWFFWSETGRITITLTDANLASMAQNETTEFAGEAVNHRNKPRKVTGRTQPTDATSGKFKIRIMADGHELVFNGTYRFGDGPK